ncbi:MAG: chitobiase/beta-hexosaminidase C-terminal domain-containing protein [Kiritimatiellae bacterium]|nr:chitobiase/beta-hexosaminidase C-terminal domain-containing protein [Kiritimatiellia bacterium]
MKLKTLLLAAVGAMAAGVAAAGDLAVSAYWQDHMVLQRGKRITVWGKNAAGRSVSVHFANQIANATTDTNGFWETTFAQPFAVSATSQTLTITDSASESITLSDVLVGDVFLAGGQSNMDRRLVHGDEFVEPQSIKDFCVDDDGIRFIRIARSQQDCTYEHLFDLPPIKAVSSNPTGDRYWGQGHDWAVATGENKNFVSSVALNFARYIRIANAERNQNIPIGIIHASSGSTTIRNWISKATMNVNGYAFDSNDGVFWNTMMAPILRAKFCAILWYQGCSDAGMQPDQYKALMDVLVKDRRDRWGENGDLPFYAVQIGTPGYAQTGDIMTIGLDQYPTPTESPSGSNYVRVREGQRRWDISDTGTHGLAVIVDHVRCMGRHDLHPVDKNFVGRRLSLFARRDLYGESDLQTEGPVFSRAVRDADGSVRITFKPGTANGLTSGFYKMADGQNVSRFVKLAGPVRGFAVCGADNVWKDAVATVEGETVVLRADGVAIPTKFHYGYWCLTRKYNLDLGQRLSLYNGDGLPMSPLPPMVVEDANLSGQVANLAMTPGSGLFSPSTNVTITCSTSGATIRYTLNGSEPTESSAIYSAPIALNATTTVKARAFAANKEPSDVAFATYTLGTAPAPTPDPVWLIDAYVPSDWAPLGENLLATATASHTGTLPNYASQDMAKLTDGKVPVNFSSNEVVGFGDMDAIWTFDSPKSIEKIRISTRWSNQSYANIGVNDVYVLKDGVWVALGMPATQKADSTGALIATLEDNAMGYLAQKVSGLKISFNKYEAAVANYIAEVEAIAPGGTIPVDPPLPAVATPTFSPASGAFYPSTSVTLSCATAGATIRYTLNGATPTATSAEYTGPIAISATTTVKARAFAEGMSPSGVATATYTYSAPVIPPDDDPTVTTNGMWITSEFAPSAWSQLANNILLGQAGTLTGGKSYMTSDITKITDGEIPVSNAQVADTFGFAENATVDWTFDGPKTLEKIRFTSCYIAGSGIYDDIKIAKIEVKSSGSDSWTDLGVEPVNFAGSNTAGTALSATLEDTAAGFLGQDVTALRITFGKQNNVAQYYAEIEAVGTAASGEPVATVAAPAFSPASCSFYPTTNVTITCATAGATIRYTLDGNDPTESSVAYTTPIAITATTTVKARAFATGKNPSAVVSATYTYTEPETPGPHVDPPDPSGESVRTWTTGDYDPSTWTSLENNILAGLTAQEVSNPSKLSFAASKDLSKLTDGAVSATADSSEIVGLQPGAELVWTFDEPKVLEKIRFSSLWSAKIYAGISVDDILVRTSASPDWVSLGVSITRSGNSSSAGAQYALLSDPGLGYLALDVVALKFVSGSVEAFANYYAEIEAVGRTGGDAYPPALSGVKIKPWGTSAEFSGSVVSVGTGASSCDVYLAYGSDANHLGASVKIYSGNAGAFHYELDGLSLNTTYSYSLSVSNNTATVMGCEASGTFTTTNEVHPDWSAYKWAVIGDSLTDPTLAPGIGNYYYNFVVADTGIQLVYTNGVGSTGYKNKYNVDGGKCFYQRLLANPLPSDVDVVTIFGSVNDWGQVSNAADAGDPTDTLADGKETLAAYMNKAIDVVQAQAPNAKLVLVGSLYYYNVVTEAHVRANETLRAVAAQRGVAFYDWLTENANDPLDFHHIADNPTAEGSFAQRYTRDCPTTIIPNETSFGHPSAEYHEVWLSPHFRGVLAAALDGETPGPGPHDDPPVSTNATWATSEFALSAWTPLENNLLANMTGTTSGFISGYGGGVGLLTDSAISGDTKQTCGFGANATVDWTFDESKTLEKIRFTTCYTANWGIYDDIKISKVEVKTSGSDSWTDLCVEPLNYAGSGTADKALSATLEDQTVGFLVQNATALRITFASPNNVAQYYAEIEAVEKTEGGVIDPPEPPATYDIAITAAVNGTLGTSVTNGIAAGTTVTVTAIPAEGYQLVSVTVNGAAIAGNTFTMPSANVTLAATFEEAELPPGPLPSAFYIGETGYDSWADAYAAAANGNTVVVGMNGSFAISGGKTLTINLAGRTLEWETSGWMYDSLTVVDTVGGGQLVLSGGNRNVGGGTVDMSSLSGAQLTGQGIFWTNADTTLKFPSDMTLAACTSKIGNAQNGMQIVVQGVTYVYDGSAWVADGNAYPEWADATSQAVTAKYDAWAAKFSVADPTAALKDAYLLNCANSAEAVAAAKAEFGTSALRVNADGTVDVGLPTAPEGGFNGTVTILGSETVDGTYHVLTNGTVVDGSYRVPATSNDRFFKATLDF